MLQDYLAKECSLNHLNYQKDAMLAPHSTFGIGGHCDYFITPFSETCLIELIAYLKKRQTRFIVIGNASNLLFDDHGFRGCVISTKAMRDVTVDGNVLTVSAGYSLIALSQLAAKHSLSGLEFACSIPGTVGGAIFMNAGAYGGEISDILAESTCFDGEKIITLSNSEHEFGYRKSVYMRGGLVCLGAKLVLERADRDEIEKKMRENMSARRQKQPLELANAGSYFKRPEGYFAGKLIEDCGLKGFSVGGAAVSEKHAGFIVNLGGATYEDVIALEEEVRKRVFERFGVLLEREVRIIK